MEDLGRGYSFNGIDPESQNIMDLCHLSCNGERVVAIAHATFPMFTRTKLLIPNLDPSSDNCVIPVNLYLSNLFPGKVIVNSDWWGEGRVKLEIKKIS